MKAVILYVHVFPLAEVSTKFMIHPRMYSEEVHLFLRAISTSTNMRFTVIILYYKAFVASKVHPEYSLYNIYRRQPELTTRDLQYELVSVDLV